MSAHRTRSRSARAALIALALVATCVAGLLAATSPSAAAAAAAAAAASPTTEAEFVADLFASCPGSGESVPAYTGPAKSCTWVPLDSSGRPIDTANGNQNGVADPHNVTTFWGAPEPYEAGHINCGGQDVTDILTNGSATTYSHSVQLTASESVSFLGIFSVSFQQTFGFQWDQTSSEALSSAAKVPAMNQNDWFVARHYRQVRGAMRVELYNRVTDPANPAGGSHWNWYPGLTWTGPAADDAGHFAKVTSEVTPLDPSGIAACANASIAQAQPLVNKFAAEFGTSASGFCATVTPEVLALACASSSGSLQTEQQFVLIPVPLTTGDNRYMIVNPAEQVCLGSGSGTVHSPVLAQPCDATKLGQLWFRVATSDNTNVFQYANASSNLCMNAWASPTSSRTKYGINQERCGDTSFSVDTQLWAATTTPFPPRAARTSPSAVPPSFTSVPRRDARGSESVPTTADTVIVVKPGSAFSYVPVAAGSPAPTITAGALPAWMSYAAGVLTGTAPIGLTGATSFPLTLTATNTAGSATQHVVVSVMFVAS